MARWLDRILDGKSLGKRERAKARALPVHFLSQLLAELQDPDLVGLYDKYAPRSFGDEQQDHLEFMRMLAQPASPRKKTAKMKSAKTIAREALQEQSAQGANGAVRELHPDRETEFMCSRSSHGRWGILRWANCPRPTRGAARGAGTGRAAPGTPPDLNAPA